MKNFVPFFSRPQVENVIFDLLQNIAEQPQAAIQFFSFVSLKAHRGLN